MKFVVLQQGDECALGGRVSGIGAASGSHRSVVAVELGNEGRGKRSGVVQRAPLEQGDRHQLIRAACGGFYSRGGGFLFYTKTTKATP